MAIRCKLAEILGPREVLRSPSLAVVAILLTSCGKDPIVTHDASLDGGDVSIPHSDTGASPDDARSIDRDSSHRDNSAEPPDAGSPQDSGPQRDSGPTKPKTCMAPDDPYLNPFSRRSAHHRPIGTGAEYASSDHPGTRDWLKATSFGVNVGAPWGVSVAESDEADNRFLDVAAVPRLCDRIEGPFPIKIRFPAEGFDTKVVINKAGCTDGVVVIYDRVLGKVHQIRQYNWSNGAPRGGQYKTWDIKGLGHGTRAGDRVGTSASGVAALFGILRGFEINTPGHKIQHALQIVLGSRPGGANKVMLANEFVLPAVSKDGFCGGSACSGHIPYGALLALPPVAKGGPELDTLGLSEAGRRLAEAVRDYGIYAVDTGAEAGGGAIRADQFVKSNLFQADIAKFHKYIRRVMNNDVLGETVAGGGVPLAPNCAADGG